MGEQLQLQITAHQAVSLNASECGLVARGHQDAQRILKQAALVADRLSTLRREAELGDREAQYELGAALREGCLQRNSNAEASIGDYLRQVSELTPTSNDSDTERGRKSKELDSLRASQAAAEEADLKLRAIKKDLCEAVQWLQKAADQGHLYASCDLGDMYLSGEGVKQNLSEAMRCYGVAADDNLDHGYWDCDAIGYMWEKAADLGHERSQYLHGAMQLHSLAGKRGERLMEGQRLLALSIASGKLTSADEADARRHLDAISSEISAEKVAQAKSGTQETKRERS